MRARNHILLYKDGSPFLKMTYKLLAFARVFVHVAVDIFIPYFTPLLAAFTKSLS